MNDKKTIHLKDLLYILRARHELRQFLLEKSDKKQLTLFCELTFNIINENLVLSQEQKDDLKSFKSECIAITSISHTLKEKRKLVAQSNAQLLDLIAEILGQYV